jgi:hypothetical protein
MALVGALRRCALLAVLALQGPGALHRGVALFCARIALQSVRPEPQPFSTIYYVWYFDGCVYVM